MTAVPTSAFSAFALEPLPEFQPGADLAGAITGVLGSTGIELQDGDVVVVAAKAVGVAENRYQTTRPSASSRKPIDCL